MDAVAMVGKQLDGTCEGRHASRLPGYQCYRMPALARSGWLCCWFQESYKMTMESMLLKIVSATIYDAREVC